MKKTILVLSVIVMLFGCKQKNKIEIIPDYDRNYYSVNMVETKAKWIGKLEPYPFQRIIEEIHKKENPNENVLYPIYLRYYINEKGKIDKVKILRHNLDVVSRRNPNPKYEEKIYTDIEKLVKKALPIMTKYEFTPAKTNGKVVKTRADVKLIYIGNKNGEVGLDETKMRIEHLVSDFDKSVEGIFFVAVEKMPEPIGGIKAIQEGIVYPELAKRAGIEGRVYVKAYVDSTGTVVMTDLLRGIGGGCDEAAINAVKKVKFIPGKQRGKRMNVQVTVPILFKLDDSQGTKQKSKSKIVGKWEGKADDNEIIRITFLSNGDTELYKSKSGRFNGKVTGATFWPKYKINYNISPYSLDLLFKSKNKEIVQKLLVKFNSNDNIILGLPKEVSIRPKNFNKENISETWKLKRVY